MSRSSLGHFLCAAWVSSLRAKKESAFPFLFPFCIFKTWSIVNLQCCVSFKCMAKWFRYTHTTHTHACAWAQLLNHIWLFSIPWTVAHQRLLCGLFQARILEWVAISTFRDLTDRDSESGSLAPPKMQAILPLSHWGSLYRHIYPLYMGISRWC